MPEMRTPIAKSILDFSPADTVVFEGVATMPNPNIQIQVSEPLSDLERRFLHNSCLPDEKLRFFLAFAQDKVRLGSRVNAPLGSELSDNGGLFRSFIFRYDGSLNFNAHDLELLFPSRQDFLPDYLGRSSRRQISAALDKHSILINSRIRDHLHLILVKLGLRFNSDKVLKFDYARWNYIKELCSSEKTPEKIAECSLHFVDGVKVILASLDSWKLDKEATALRRFLRQEFEAGFLNREFVASVGNLLPIEVLKRRESLYPPDRYPRLVTGLLAGICRSILSNLLNDSRSTLFG